MLYYEELKFACGNCKPTSSKSSPLKCLILTVKTGLWFPSVICRHYAPICCFAARAPRSFLYSLTLLYAWMPALNWSPSGFLMWQLNKLIWWQDLLRNWRSQVAHMTCLYCLWRKKAQGCRPFHRQLCLRERGYLIRLLVKKPCIQFWGLAFWVTSVIQLSCVLKSY